MFQTKMKLFVIKACFAISALFCIYYFTTTHFEFMLSLFHYFKFNVSSISYTLLRPLQVVFAIVLFVPEKKLNKPKLLKYITLAIGIIYITGSSWIIYFLRDNPLSALKDTTFTSEYLQLHALNFGYLVWGTYDIYSIIFSILEALIYILLSDCIACKRRKTIVVFWISVFLGMVLPFIYIFAIHGTDNFSYQFLPKNTILFTSQIFMGAGLTVAGSTRQLWKETIWK